MKADINKADNIQPDKTLWNDRRAPVLALLYSTKLDGIFAQRSIRLGHTIRTDATDRANPKSTHCSSALVMWNRLAVVVCLPVPGRVQHGVGKRYTGIFILPFSMTLIFIFLRLDLLGLNCSSLGAGIRVPDGWNARAIKELVLRRIIYEWRRRQHPCCSVKAWTLEHNENLGGRAWGENILEGPLQQYPECVI